MKKFATTKYFRQRKAVLQRKLKVASSDLAALAKHIRRM